MLKTLTLPNITYMMLKNINITYIINSLIMWTFLLKPGQGNLESKVFLFYLTISFASGFFAFVLSLFFEWPLFYKKTMWTVLSFHSRIVSIKRISMIVTTVLPPSVTLILFSSADEIRQSHVPDDFYFFFSLRIFSHIFNFTSKEQMNLIYSLFI